MNPQHSKLRCRYSIAILLAVSVLGMSIESTGFALGTAADLNSHSAAERDDKLMERFESPAVNWKWWKTGPEWYETVHWAGTGASGWKDGVKGEAQFRFPSGLLAEPDGSLLIADTRNHRLRTLNEAGQVRTIAGAAVPIGGETTPKGSLRDGAAAQAIFSEPAGMAKDKAGNLYIADSANHVIRKLDRDGQVTTIAGDGVAGWKDGAGTSARFNKPRAIAAANDGTLYVADALNHVIRRIDPKGKVTTLNARSERIVEYSPGAVAAAGDFLDGALAQARFNEPSGLVMNADGQLIVADTGNHRIRLVDVAKQSVATLAGSSSIASYTKHFPDAPLYAAGGYRDGKASEALFNGPAGIALTEEGGVVVADRWNHAIRYVYKGNVYTLSGHAEQSGAADGIAAFAEFHEPAAVAVLPNGTIAVADAFNNAIRLIRRYELPQGVMPSDSELGATDREIQLVYNRRLVKADAAPVLKSGRAYVPLRVAADTLGYKTEWSAGGQLRVSFGAIEFEMQAGSKQAVKREHGTVSELQLQEAPFVHDGHVVVPLRFVAEQFGFHVQWINQARAVVIRDRIYLRYEATGSQLPLRR